MPPEVHSRYPIIRLPVKQVLSFDTQSDLRLTVVTPYLNLTGVCCENSKEN